MHITSSSVFECFNSLPLNSQEYLHLPPSLSHVFVAKLYLHHQQSIILPLSYTDDSIFLEHYFKSLDIPVYTFPFYDILVYEDGEPSSNILLQRIQTLFAIKQKKSGVYLVSLKSLLFGVPNINILNEELSLTIKTGNHLDRQEFINKMTQWSYLRVPQVDEPGQFALRGEILEFWDITSPKPGRIYLDDTLIEKIVLFSISSSDPNETLQELTLHSLRDFIYTPKRNKEFLDFLKTEKAPHQIEYFKEYQNQHHNIHFIPFFYQYSLIDLFKEADHPYILLINQYPQLESLEKNWSREIKELFNSSFNIHKIMLHPSIYHFKLNTIVESASQIIYFSPFASVERENSILVSDFIKPINAYNGKIEQFQIDLENYPNFEVMITVESEINYEKLLAIFPKLEIHIYPYLKNGFIDLINKKVWVTDQDLFGKRQAALKQNKAFIQESVAIDHFSDLNQGDYIVHIHHGIGIYQGIEKMSIMGSHKDYIKISYADEETLYIPIEQIFLVHKYLGNSNPTLHNIGGKKWEQKKAKVAKQIEDMSEDLVILYESRKKSLGFPFPADTPLQAQFDALFPYDPTDGQLQAIEDIKRDMESPLVMDRLICGDVGYGKTEVAARAIFKAVSAGKQVAFLAPTTLLVEQHYRGLLVRFGDFPVNIRMICRTVSLKEQKEIQKGLADGSVDIVVGTHSLFSSKVEFKDLGLLVIDEEQRFGVKHKEKVKEKNPLVDSLTLSATPIPRTLYMGLSSFRDMSVITTPPVARLPIKTYVMPFSEEIIQSSIQREIERGGQIFMIHNRVKTINTFADFVQKIVPSARILVGHAQMNPHEMEEIFLDFIAHKADILISTTIVESGIDIPNANTMIIDKPEMLGLGELYQLRGRVGRAKKQGYAYLFYDGNTGLTPTMQKRLETIEENTSLGSGFQIAMRDLEIRGAGNLLGKDQSGLFDDVGIELYSQILKNVVHKIKGTPAGEIEPVMDLPFDGHIPEGYVTQEQERFTIYKNLMRAKDLEQLYQMTQSIIDNYGPIPTIMENLFKVSQIKILARKLEIKELRYKANMYEIYFATQPDINTPFLVPFIQKHQAKLLNNQAIVVQEALFKPHFLDDINFLLENLIPKKTS